MPNRDFDLARVISPVTLDEFREQYWEKQPLLVRREDPGYYTSLLSMSDVDDLVCTRDLRAPALRLVKKGAQIPLSSYTSNVPWGGDTFANVVDVDRVFAEYQQGATIVLQALHRYWRPLGIFCRDLEKQFNYPVQTNIYLTPPSAQGFAVHYDTHDVFVLQLAGEKHWLIYNSPVPLPDKNKPYDKATTPPAELLYEVDLRAGDLIYLPRGFVHEALTSGRESLHITVGVVVYTWGDLLAEALDQLRRRDARFRASLPPGLLTREGAAAELQSGFEDLLRTFGEETDLDRVVGRIADRFLTTRLPLQEGRLADLDRLPGLTLQTTLLRRGTALARLAIEGDEALLRYEGKTIRMPAYVAPVLRFITEHERFSAAELPRAIDDEGKLVLLRRLVREGFLSIDRGE